jgi:4-amino-4-deoxy-L-arabinose transferase-like glycosyltransferase
MDQNPKSEEIKSKANEAAPRENSPLWLVTSLLLFLASLISIISYFFLKRRSGTQQAKVGIPQAPVKVQAEQMNVIHKEEAASGGSVLRWLLILGVLALGLTGQLLLPTDNLLGAIFIGLAALLFVVIFRNQPSPGSWLTAEPWGRQPFNLNWSLVGKYAFGTAILFAVLAFWLFGEDVPSFYPWILHLLSIGLLIFSSIWINKLKNSTEVLDNQSNNKKWNWLEAGIFLVILAIAAFMRLYRFDQIPFGLWYDEADNGLSALEILNQPGYLPVFVKSTNLPAHFLYLISFSFRILGVSSLTIRAVSVVFGMATVAASFFLGSELFNRRMGLVLAFFLAISRWDVNWSRIGMHGVTVPFFEILSAVLLLRALRKQSLLDYTLAGLSLGLGLCFYTPLFFFPIVIGVFLLFLWLHRHDLLFSSWAGFLFLGLAFLVISVPYSQFAIRQTDSFDDRLSVTSIFTGKTTQEAWKAVARTTREHLLMFNYHGDNNGRHNLAGEPMLDPISGTFMVLGVALSLWRIRRPGSFLLIAWLLIMLMPGIFSLDFESPQTLRAIGSLPPTYLLCVVPIHALWQEWEQFSGRRFLAAFILPLILVLGVAGYINYHIYFDLQSERFDSWFVFSTPETIVGKAMAELGPQVDPYISIFYSNSPTIRFLAPELKEYHLLQTFDSLPFLSDGKKTRVFFVDQDREQFFLQAQRYYPNADFKEYKTPNGGTALYQITLDHSDIEASQGITVSYYRNEDWLEQPFLVTTEKTINMDWKDGDPAPFPFGVKWQGILFVDRYGVYRLTLHSPSPSELYLDNAQISLVDNGDGVQTAEIELAEGCHDLIIKTLGQEGHFELDWQPPEGEQTLVPSSHLLLPPINNNGLLGYYYANGDWQAPPAFIKIDPWIHFFYQEQPLPIPFTAEWVGRINIPSEGSYRFALESVDESELFIDNEQITTSYNEGEIYLSPGFHQLRLRYAARTGYTHINLYWTTPGSERESIPQEVLFLP